MEGRRKEKGKGLWKEGRTEGMRRTKAGGGEGGGIKGREERVQGRK
jgi:hypothetical protein